MMTLPTIPECDDIRHGYEACSCSCHESMPVDALTQDECDAIGADGRDGRGWVTQSNLTQREAEALATYRLALLDAKYHDDLPYGQNCPRCGIDHAAIWPTMG